MQKRALIFAILAMMIIGMIPSILAQALGSDIVFSHAQSFPESKIKSLVGERGVTDADIEFAQARVIYSEKDCNDMGGIWCTYAEQDRLALQKLMNVKGQSISGSGTSDGTISTQKPSVWKQLWNIFKGLFGFD
ncbi:MAG: hypothetical protein KKE23_01485 [Nanoarchaeota archaeon]|nr:hypothetical protein [Nanoarchaeota archaeon]